MRLLLLLAYNLLRLITWPLWGFVPWLRRPKGPWVWLRVRGGLDELPGRPGSLLQRLASRLRPAHLSVHEIRTLAAELARDGQVRGVILSLASLRAGWATLESLQAALTELRAAGKRLVVLLPEGADQRELWIASMADEVFTTPPASFSALGAAAQRPYLASFLAKLGVEVQVFAEGQFKTAAEALVRDTMSAAEREQLTALLGTIQQRWVEALAGRVPGGRAQAEGLLERAMFSPELARELKLVDKVCYPDEWEAQLELPLPRKRVGARRYVRARRRRLFVPLRAPRRFVALVRLVGPIGSSNNPRGISLQPTCALLRSLRENPRVAGVILHIDSPGGSAFASELIHRELVRLAADKPVVAWLGNVAASGGYYIAVGARSIVAQPTTITGSIGVISARPVASALFAQLGIRPEVVKLAPHADLHSLRPADADEVALIFGETRRFYARFLEVVAQGRGRSVADIEPLAGGRVWSGADAHARGLIDTLGGYREARHALDALLGAEAAKCAVEPRLYEPAVLGGAGGAAVELARMTRELVRAELSDWLADGQDEVAQEWSMLQAALARGERLLAYAPLRFTGR